MTNLQTKEANAFWIAYNVCQKYDDPSTNGFCRHDLAILRNNEKHIAIALFHILRRSTGHPQPSDKTASIRSMKFTRLKPLGSQKIRAISILVAFPLQDAMMFAVLGIYKSFVFM
jgi:hypothetical protein